MLSRKYYKEIALIIKKVKATEEVKTELINLFSDYFIRDNPNFDEEKFIKAIKE